MIETITKEVETIRSELNEYKNLIHTKEKEILELTISKDKIFEGSSDMNK